MIRSSASSGPRRSCVAAARLRGSVPGLLLVALFAAPALAGDSPWFLEGRLASAALDNVFRTNHSQSFDDDDLPVSLELGYELHRFLAIQAGYHELGEYDGIGSLCPPGYACVGEIERLASQVDLPLCALPGCQLVEDPLVADVSGWSLSFMPRLPASERWTVFGRLGVLDWEADVSLASRGLGQRIEHSDTGLVAGLGLRRSFASGLGLFVDYQWVELDIESLGVGAAWRF